MTSPDDRRKAMEILDDGIANGAPAPELALLLGVGLTTLQLWRLSFLVTVMAPTYARAATATWQTASVSRNTNRSC